MNHRCSDFRERLGPYLDGELEESSAREFERHLEDCPSCRSALEEMRTADRLLREGLAADEIDYERSEYTLNETLDRIRREPSPAWEPERPKRRRSRTFGWNWRLRWLAGIAAATAAVFLALRLGPEPMAPEKPRSIPHRPQPVEMTNGVETTSKPALPTKVAAPEPDDVIDKTAVPKPSSPAEPRGKGAGYTDSEEKPYGTLEEPIAEVSGAPLKPEGTQGVVLMEAEETEPRIRAGRSESPQTDAPREIATVDMEEKKSHLQESATQRVLAADRWGDDAMTAGAIAPDASKGEVSESDTLGSPNGLPERLEVETRNLLRTSETERNRGERARRWRTIGDLWEWIGRQEDSPTAFAKAIAAYRMAAEIDPQAAGLDSTRVQRARDRSAEEIEGNIVPAHR